MANIHDKLNKIITSIFGKDVRQALYDGLDVVNKETENTTAKQEDLENTFEQLVINAGTSNAEIVDARVDKNTGKSYSKVGERMDEVSAYLADIVQYDLKDYPRIVPEVNDDGRFTRALNSMNIGGKLIVPHGNYTVSTVNFNKRNIIIEAITHAGVNQYGGGAVNITVTDRGFVYNENSQYLLHGGLTIKGITFIGAETALSGLVLLRTSDVYIEHCKFIDFTNVNSKALVVGDINNNSQYGKIFACNFFNVNIGLSIENHNGLRAIACTFEGKQPDWNGTVTIDSLISECAIQILKGDTLMLTDNVIQFFKKGIIITNASEGHCILGTRLEACKIGYQVSMKGASIYGGFFNNYIVGGGGTAIDMAGSTYNTVVGYTALSGGDSTFANIDATNTILCPGIYGYSQISFGKQIKIGDIEIGYSKAKTMKIYQHLEIDRHLYVGKYSTDGRVYFGTSQANSIYPANSDSGLKVSKKLFATEGIGVGNSISATTLGKVVKKIEIFNSEGVSLGFIPVYDSII